MRRSALAVLLLIALAAPAADQFPKGCVDCHSGKMKITGMMASWTKAVPPATLAKMPKSPVLKGKHPTVTGKDIPGSCLKCHTGKTIPALAPLVHSAHFGGAKNEFVAKFGGDCRHCHKFDVASAAMKLPSGPEK